MIFTSTAVCLWRTNGNMNVSLWSGQGSYHLPGTVLSLRVLVGLNPHCKHIMSLP